MAQFVLEAAMLGAAGGIAGIALGMGGLHLLATSGGERNIADVTWLHCVEVVLLGAVISAMFAVIPAYRASQLDPVDALKAE
jgi:putative ABC transport system permease protein